MDAAVVPDLQTAGVSQIGTRTLSSGCEDGNSCALRQTLGSIFSRLKCSKTKHRIIALLDTSMVLFNTVGQAVTYAVLYVGSQTLRSLWDRNLAHPSSRVW